MRLLFICACESKRRKDLWAERAHDPALTAEGQRQALALACFWGQRLRRRPKIHFACSPMRRALQTLAPLMQQCEGSRAEIMPQLQEIGGLRSQADFDDEGGWRGTATRCGLTGSQVAERYPWADAGALDPSAPWFSPQAKKPSWTGSQSRGFLGWETDSSAAVRARACMDWLQDLQQRLDDGELLVVASHPRFGSLLFQCFLEMPPSSQAFLFFQLDSGSVSCLHLPYRPLQQLTVQFLNRTNHLLSSSSALRQEDGTKAARGAWADSVVGPVSRL